MTKKEVDRPGPAAMAAWLRETAANTRRYSNATWCEAHCKPYDPLAAHVAFRMEQAADMIVELAHEPSGELEALRTERYRLRSGLGAIIGLFYDQDHEAKNIARRVLDSAAENRRASNAR